MIEILPNWHPVFVHFSIALLSMSVLFFLVQVLFPAQHRWQSTLTILANANLWLGTGFAIITAIAGWFAYNSVNHDTASHAAMTDHRNWALVTLAVFIVLTFWSTRFRRKSKAPVLFVIAMLIAGGLLASTGWRGAEAVYRYGLGVMSLPESTGEGHAHEHPDGQGHDNKPPETSQTAPSMTQNMPSTSKDKASHSHETNQGVNEAIAPPATAKEASPQQDKKSAHDSIPHTH